MANTGNFSISSFSKGEDFLSLTDALSIGRKLEFLSQASCNPEKYQVGKSEGGGILGKLQEIENILTNTELESPVIGKVAGFRVDLEEEYDDPGSGLSNADSQKLQQKAVTWANLLQESFKDEKRIPASKTGLLDTTKLVEEPEKLLSPYVWNWLDDTAKTDIEEACRSIAVGCPTGCVFLSLRAVEHSLRRWYESRYEKIESTAWGAVLDELMEEYAAEEKKNDTVLSQLSELPPVLTNLYYLKEKRNEVGHPDHSPDEQEARRTLMIVAGTITDVYSELEEHRIADLEIPTYADNNVDDVEDLMIDVITRIERKSDGHGASRKLVLDTAEEAGLENEEAENALQELLMTGRVYEPEKGSLMPI